MVNAAIPPDLCSLADYERRAGECLDPATWAWLQGGSGDEHTLRGNRAALAAVRLYQRVLRRGGHGSTRLQLLGATLQHPILLAPVAFQRMVHAEGEVAVARAAAATDTAMVLSTLSSCLLEDVAAHAPPVRWFQLYLQPRRDDTQALLRRAEAAGYTAIVVTLDVPVQSPPRAAQRHGFALAEGVIAANLAMQQPPPRVQLEAGDSLVLQGAMAEAPGWEDLDWLLRNTTLPVVAKGVSHPDDAARLRAAGVSAQVVSNHGGRALDGCAATLELLPALRSRLGGDYPLLLDGGVRSGSDVFKALALGADAVLVGRPQLHALAVAGALGVAHMLRLLREELELCMAQAGCLSLAEIDADAVFPPAALFHPPANGPAAPCC